ncbi:hypothetical protein Lal_00034641 [Lupinus albus]|nr:hypothetical protein Lal_00034641 [Lupinus albus]
MNLRHETNVLWRAWLPKFPSRRFCISCFVFSSPISIAACFSSVAFNNSSGSWIRTLDLRSIEIKPLLTTAQ